MNLIDYPTNPNCKKHKETRMIYDGSPIKWEEPLKIFYACPETNCSIQAEFSMETREMTWR